MKITGVATGLLWLFAAYVYAGLVGGRLPYFILYASIGVMAVSFLWSMVLRDIQVTSSLDTNRSEVGRVVILRIRLENKSFIPLPWIHCSMALPEIFGPGVREASFGCHLKSRERMEIEIPLHCQVRGFFQWGRIEVSAGDIFGMLKSVKMVENRLNLLVRPGTQYLGRYSLAEGDALLGNSKWSLRPGRQATDFRGVRRYNAGDPLSRIHWKASVRAQRFLVKEYEQALFDDMMLFLDLSSSIHAGDGYDNSVERGVELTASLAATAIQNGLRVGCSICSGDLSVVPPARSKGHLGLILDFLARAVAAPGMSYTENLMRTALEHSRGTLLALVTPEVNNDLLAVVSCLKAKGYRLLIVVVKAEDFGLTNLNLHERDQLVARFRHIATRVVLVDRSSDLRALFGGMQNEAC